MFIVIFSCAIALIQDLYYVFSMAFCLGNPCKKNICGCVVARFMDYDHILSYKSTWSSKVTQLKVLMITHILAMNYYIALCARWQICKIQTNDGLMTMWWS